MADERSDFPGDAQPPSGGPATGRNTGRWLDRDAAERLLRGEPLDGVDAYAREEAGRLADALDALAAEALRGTDELPGEAAALAAFRKVRDGRTYVGPERRPAVDGDAVGGAIRIGRTHRGGPPTPRRRARWGRPVRYGLAAALAGFMVGGVAVAASTGVLPSPFGGNDEPGPAASVSAAATPEQPLVSPSPGGSGPGGESSGAPTPDGTSGRPDPGASSRGTEARPGGASSDPRSGSGGAKGSKDTAAEKWTRVVTACRDYRNGTLDGDRRRRLEDAAKGAERVETYCDRVLERSDGASQGGDGGDGKGDGDDKGGSGDKDGGQGDGAAGDASGQSSGLTGSNSPSYFAPSLPVPTPSASYSALPVPS